MLPAIVLRWPARAVTARTRGDGLRRATAAALVARPPDRVGEVRGPRRRRLGSLLAAATAVRGGRALAAGAFAGSATLMVLMVTLAGTGTTYPVSTPFTTYLVLAVARAALA